MEGTKWGPQVTLKGLDRMTSGGEKGLQAEACPVWD